MRISVFRSRGVAEALCALLLVVTPCSFGLAQVNPPFAVEEPWQTVQTEHRDREARLSRLAYLRGIAAPHFYEYAIARAQHGLAAYPVDLPVLRVVFSDKVFFDFNKDELRRDSNPVLATVAQSLRLEPPDVTVFVAGHTDGIGSVDYNLGLGLRRAQAVAVALARLKVKQAQIFVVSFGKAVPIAPNDSETGRAQNRRVEFLFAARPEPIAAWLAEQHSMTCGPDQSAKGNDCPTDLHFIARSVSLGDASQDVDVRRPVADMDVGKEPRTVAVKTAGKAVTIASRSKEIVIGSKTIDIDLRQKVFTMPPPE